MDIPHGTVVVVADGEKLLYLRNEGDEAYPNLEVERKKVQDNPATSEQGTDSPGRTANSGNGRRSSIEPTDFHQLAEDRFAAEVADLLKRRALEGDFEKLIIAAPPRTLGELRKHYHVEVEKRLIGEIDKTFTGMPVDAIEEALAAA